VNFEWFSVFWGFGKYVIKFFVLCLDIGIYDCGWARLIPWIISDTFGHSSQCHGYLGSML